MMPLKSLSSRDDSSARSVGRSSSFLQLPWEHFSRGSSRQEVWEGVFPVVRK